MVVTLHSCCSVKESSSKNVMADVIANKGFRTYFELVDDGKQETQLDQPFPEEDDLFILINTDDEHNISLKKLEINVERAPFSSGSKLNCSIKDSLSNKRRKFKIKKGFGSKTLKYRVRKTIAAVP